MNGFIRTVRVTPTKINQKVQKDLAHKKMMQESKRRKNEILSEDTILEFLEGCPSWLDDSLSTSFFYRTRILYDCDI